MDKIYHYDVRVNSELMERKQMQEKMQRELVNILA